MLRGYRFRLYPTPAQDAAMRQHAGTVRFVYNLALEQREQFGRQYRRVTDRNLNFISQDLELTKLVVAVDWIRDAPRGALTQALRDLDRAYANFFSGRARYPTRRKRGLNDTFRIRGKEGPRRKLSGKWSAVLVPKIGRVRYRDTRPLPCDPLSATYTLAGEQWFVSFTCESPDCATSPLPESLGIDRGVANTLALSTGELLSLPASLAALDRRRRQAQRILARRHRGSRRYQRQRRRVAALHAKVRRIRTDWHHKVTAGLARRFGVVSLEDLRVPSMTARGRGKRGLNRVILDQGWGTFERLLAYKLEAAGGRLVKVPPAYTSQTCSACGCIDRRSRESQAVFRCIHCGHEDHADINAAINIRRALGPLLDGEGGQLGRPFEASTLAA